MKPELIALLGVGAAGLYLQSQSTAATAKTGSQTNSLLGSIEKSLANMGSGSASKPAAGSSGGGSSGGGGSQGGGTSGGGGSEGGWNDLPQWLQDLTDPFASGNQAPIDDTPSYDDPTLIPIDSTPIDDSGIYASVDPFGGGGDTSILDDTTNYDDTTYYDDSGDDF